MKRAALAAIAATAGIAPAPLAQAAEIPIGVLLPLTGPLATFAGVGPRNAILLGADEVREKGTLGSHTLKVIIEDMAADKAQAITLVTRFIKRDNVAVIVGPPTTIFGGAVVPIANLEKTPILVMAATATINGSGPWAFRVMEDNSMIANGITEFVLGQLKPKSYAVVYGRDNESYVTMRQFVSTTMDKAGVNKVGEFSFLTSETDFSVIATKLADVSPDVLILISNANQAANVAIQARRAGLKEATSIIGAGVGFYPHFPRIGGAAVNGAYVHVGYNAQNRAELNQAFVTKYRAKYGIDPDDFAAWAYTAFNITVDAIKRTGITSGSPEDRQKLRDALAATRNVPSILGSGTFSFDVERAPIYGYSILQVKDGQLMQVK